MEQEHRTVSPIGGIRIDPGYHHQAPHEDHSPQEIENNGSFFRSHHTDMTRLLSGYIDTTTQYSILYIYVWVPAKVCDSPMGIWISEIKSLQGAGSAVTGPYPGLFSCFFFAGTTKDLENSN